MRFYMPDANRLNILSIQDAVDKILVYSQTYSNADMFYANQRDFDAVMMNFIVVGEMVSRLSEKFIEQNPHVDWFKIRGFRNIVAHNYLGIDAEEVWQIIKIHIPKLKTDIKDILDNM
jgi:uncharacterized protein with HEPN domain